jgi:glyoxylase-like metal-dependent hydrolase (beta-lactamase superfamily II)
LKLGDVELELVGDGTLHVDGGGVFGIVPRALWERVSTPDGDNRVPLALNCLLIRSGGSVLLVDTGLGERLSERSARFFGLERQSDLLANLGRLGIVPEDVDIVINTHLHLDHCGWNTRQTRGEWAPTFPRAEYWIQRGEWEEANQPNELTRSSYLPRTFRPLAGRVHLMEGDEAVTSEVRCVITRGHTRYHQSVIIESGGRSAAFLGDLALLPVQLERLNWLSAYDTEPLETLSAKRVMVDWAVRRQALIILEHEPLSPMGTLQGRDGRIVFSPTPGPCLDPAIPAS